MPLPEGAVGPDGRLNLELLADRLGLPLVAEKAHSLWTLGPETAIPGRSLATAAAPELILPDLEGKPFSLSTLRGQKVLLVVWGSWCGCRADLPVWQDLRTELHPHGLEIVTVALDVDPEHARPYIEAAAPTHPSLIDQAHVVDELFGIVNVPNGVWIDEDARIVRPAEQAYPGADSSIASLRGVDLSTFPNEVAELLGETSRIQAEPELYVTMVRDWVEQGADSRYALSVEEVIRRSGERTDAESRAAAHFELGQALHHCGNHQAAIPHWREAHRLAPDNWTYRRNAWDFEDPDRQGRTDAYDSSWLEDIRAIGAENYYPPIIP